MTPPERVVQTFEWEGMPGHVVVEGATFEDLDERTKVTTTSLFHTPQERDGMLASDMYWPHSGPALGEVLAHEPAMAVLDGGLAAKERRRHIELCG